MVEATDQNGEHDNATTTTATASDQTRSLSSQQPSQFENGGYCELAEFITSSPSHTFQIFRRFGALNARCLLYMQDELGELEQILGEYDSSDVSSVSRRFDQHPDRGALMAHIAIKLAEYNAFLVSVSQTLALGPASEYQISNFHNYFDIYRPVVDEESGFLDNRHDLVSLHKSETDWLHHALNRANLRLFSTDKRTQTIPTPLLMAKNELMYTEQRKLQRAVRGLTLLFGLFSLITPILIMYFNNTVIIRVAVVCVAVTVFGTALLLLSTAKNAELLAAMAAYTAVLVVFLGTIS